MATRLRTKKSVRKTSKSTSVVNNSPVEAKSGRLVNLIRNPVVFFGIIILILGGAFYFLRSYLIAATVNGKPISRLSVISELEKQGGAQVLDTLVSKELIAQEAAKKGITVSEDDINGEIGKLDESLKTQGQTMDQFLASQFMTMEDLHGRFETRLLIERLLTPDIAVGDDEVDKYVTDNKAILPTDLSDDELKAQVKEQLLQQKIADKFDTWINDLKTNSIINYLKKY